MEQSNRLGFLIFAASLFLGTSIVVAALILKPTLNGDDPATVIHSTVIISPTPRASSRTNNHTDGLVAYYPFSGNANDESGNENHGIIHGATLTSDRFGRPDHAFLFDGLDDRIDVEKLHPTLETGDFSIAGWIKTTHQHSDSNGTAIVDKYPQNHKPWTLRLQPDGRIRFICDESIYSIDPVNDGQRHHFVVLRSQSTIKLYIDNELQGSARSTTSAPNNRTLSFGCVHWPGGGLARFFQGTLDDMSVYNRALTAAEIQELYRQGD